jgi:diacylglycerol O-acyltransferase
VIDAMRPLDAMFWYAEDGTSHMHIGCCAVFAGPGPTIEDVTNLIGSKLPRLIRYRQKVKAVPGGLGLPVWVDDARFDLTQHVRRIGLPPPGGDAELEAVMSELMSHELDRRRPLWEAWMVEGLSGARWALISKVHHCMVDGIAGADLMAAILDADDDAVLPPIEAWSPQPEPSAAALAAAAAAKVVLGPLRTMASLGTRPQPLRRTMEQVGHVATGLAGLTRLLVTRPRPVSMAGAIGPRRRWVVARCSLDDVKAVKRALGGSVNDVVLAAVTGAFRAALLGRGEHVGSDAVLRSLVPVSVRRAGDRSPNNQVSLMIAELPIGIADRFARYRAVTAQMAALKSSHEVDAGQAVITGAAAVPPVLFAVVVRATVAMMRRFHQQVFNTVTTNVPGPQFPLYALGRQMLEYLPFVPLTEGMPTGVAILSYNGQVAFGITADDDKIPDAGDIARHVEEEVDLLRQGIERRSAAGRRRHHV